jgi:[NiFe] hydrogenase assembly HybE family chaperone
MKNPTELAAEIKDVFDKINREQMAGLPIVNPMLDVDVVGFQEHDGRTIGVITTPWLMTLAVFPGDDDDWSDVKIGDKRKFPFPARDYQFLANEIDGIGTYYGYAIYSPMNEFDHHDHALAGANGFMELLMIENENAENELDEERLALFLQGEDMESIKQKECATKNPVVDGEITLKTAIKEPLDRRQLLRGEFLGDVAAS